MHREKAQLISFLKRGVSLEMSVLLELLRILFIFVILGGIGWGILENMYRMNEATEDFSGLGSIAILLLLFVLYRNKLQFSGWYEGKEKEKLPKTVSFLLICSSILLLIAPFVIGYLVS